MPPKTRRQNLVFQYCTRYPEHTDKSAVCYCDFVLVRACFTLPHQMGLGALMPYPSRCWCSNRTGYGGTTGYAINPPEIWGRGWPMPYCLSKANNWSYAWVPV